MGWDKQFRINKQDVEKMVSDPTAPIPHSIINWPTVSADGSPMAPYYDTDGDGAYNPAAGDYPDLHPVHGLGFYCRHRPNQHQTPDGL